MLPKALDGPRFIPRPERLSLPLPGLEPLLGLPQLGGHPGRGQAWKSPPGHSCRGAEGLRGSVPGAAEVQGDLELSGACLPTEVSILHFLHWGWQNKGVSRPSFVPFLCSPWASDKGLV